MSLSSNSHQLLLQPQRQQCWKVFILLLLTGYYWIQHCNAECMQPMFSCDGSGSGNSTDDPMEDECPPPDCVNITLLTLDEVNVSFSLDCTPTNLTSCSYSYLLQFITPYEGDEAVIFYNETGPVSSQYIDNGSFILYPTNGDMFVPGSLLRVFIFLSNNLTFNTSDDLLVPGVFAPDISNLIITSFDNTSLTLSWQLRYPLVPPDSYYIIYNYTGLVGASSSADNITLTIQKGDVAVTNDANVYVLGSLLPYTRYTVTLSPLYRDEEGEGLTVSGETMEGMSSEVVSPSVVIDRENMRLNISWSEPLYPGGVIMKYEITLSIDGAISLTINTTDLSVTAAFKYHVTYNIRITPFNSFGSGNDSDIIMIVTPEGAPTPPLNFTLIQSSSSSLEASWVEPATLNGVLANYTITCQVSSTQFYSQQIMTSKLVNAVSPTNTTATITDLDPFTTYDCYVTASTGGGESSPSNNVSNTTSEAVPSGPPEGFNVTEVTATSVSLEWRRPSVPNGVIINYILQYSTNTDTIPVTFNSTNDEYNVTSITVKDLNEYTNYTFNISAVTNGGTGPFDSIERRTDSSVPTAPQSVTYENTSSTTIRVSWDPPTDFNGPNEGYEVSYVRLETNVQNTTGRLTTTSVDINNLEIYEEYNLTVAAFTDKGAGATSEILSILTDEDVPGIVSDFTATEINTTAIRVEWDKPADPNGIIIVYELENSITGEEPVVQNYTAMAGSYSIVLADLNAFSTYNIKVRAYTSVGAGAYVDKSVRTDPAASSPPTNITATTITQTSLVLNWSPPSDPNGNIEGYYIRYNATFPNTGNITTSELSNNEEVLNVSSSVTTITFTDLSPYTLYTFSIAAYSFQHADNNSPFMIVMGQFSEDTSFRTLEAAPTPPLNFTLIQSSSPSSLEASWVEPATLNGVLSNYTITCQVSSTQFYSQQIMGSRLVDTVSPTSTTATITDLNPFTTYDCYVTASTGGGESSPSNTESNKTSEAVPSGPPEGFNVTEVTATSVSLEWRRPSVPNGVIINYILQYSTNTDTIPVTFNSTNDEYNVTSITVKDLNEYTNYTFNISAVTNGGTGPGAITSTRTSEAAPSSPPQSLDGFNTSANSLRISWSEPSEDGQNGVIIGYNISYYSVPGGTISNRATTDTSYDITGLDPYTLYNVSVAAYTSVGTGPFDSIERRTDSSVPTAPQSVTYENTSSTTIRVSWDPPTDFNGPNEGYEVSYVRLETNVQNTTGRLTDTSVDIDNLEIYEEYNLTVAAFTDKGAGATSEILSILTDEDVPGIVSSFTATEINTTAIRVEWDKPADPNGIIIVYELESSITGEEPVVQNYTAMAGSYSIVLADLNAFSTYNIKVRAYTSVGAGAYVVKSVRTDPAASSPPTNITATTITQTSLVLNWSPPSDPNGNIEGYYIRYNATFPNTGNITTSELSNNEEVLNVSSSVTTITFTDLSPYTLYTFSIAAYSFQHADNNSPFMIVMGQFSEDTSFRTLEAAPTPPLNFTLIQSSSSSSLEASWVEPATLNGVLANYTITCQVSSTQFYSQQIMGSRLVDTVSPTSTTATITDLNPFTTYDCYVTASTGGGESSPSNTESNTTSEAVPSGPPEGFNVTEVTATSVSLEWRRPSVPNGVIINYILQYSTNTDTLPVTFNSTNDEYNVTSITVKDLNEYTNYTFNISAVTNGGTGPGAITSMRTSEAAPSSPPQSLDGFNTSANSLRISWSEPSEDGHNGVIIGYNISYYSVPGGTISNRATTDTSYDITGLDPYTLYNVSVAAYTSVGTGPFDSIERRTDSSIPTAPQSVTYDNTSSTTIRVSWDPPTDFNGPNEGYEVSYVRLETNVQNTTGRLTDTSVDINNLEIYEEYNLTVAAFTDKGAGATSEILSILTDEDVPGIVSSFTATEINTTAIRVEWDKPADPNGIIIVYELENSITGEEPVVQNYTAMAGSYSIVLADLNAFSTYNIKVRAYTSVGAGAYVVKSVRTDPAASSPPTNITATTITQTSLVLNWSPPSDPNGNIEGYYIRYNATFPNTGNITTSELSNNEEVLNVSSSVTTITFTDLSPYTLYTFSIAAYSFQHADNNSPFMIVMGQFSEDTSFRTLEAAPTPPLNFTLIQSSSSSSLEASWVEPATLNGVLANYTITCQVSSTQFYSQQIMGSRLVDTVSPTSTTATITDLNPFTTYDCYVTASTGGGESSPSNTESNTTSEAVPSGPPEGFNVTEVTATSVSLEWRRPSVPNGVIINYILQYSTNTYTIPVTFNSTNDEYNVTSITVKDLNEYTNYTFNISAVTNGGTGPGATTSTRTSEAAPSSPPQSLDGFNTSANSLRISWSEPLEDGQNGVIIGYNISYYSVPGGTISNRATTDTSYDITGLNPYTLYNVSVAAYTSVGTGPFDSIERRTDSSVPTAPQSVTYENTSSTTIRVSWDPPTDFNGPNEGYEVSYVRLETNVQNTTGRLTTTSVDINNLEIYEEYNLTVVAFTDKGAGTSSEILLVLTDEDFPGPPFNASIYSVSATSFGVSWSPPLEPNGLIVGYHINYTLQSAYAQYLPSSDGSHSVSKDSLSLSLQGLHSFADYNLTLQAQTSVGLGTPAFISVMTLEAAPSSPVIKLNATAFNATSIRVNWFPPPLSEWNGIINYTITFTSNDEFITHNGSILADDSIDPRTAAISLETESFIITGLHEFVNYSFVVTIATSVGSVPSSPVYAVTLKSAPSGPPLLVSVTVLSSSSALITWTPPTYAERNGLITHYILRVTNNSGQLVIPQVNTTDSFYNATNLPQYASFSVSIAAVTGEGVGPYSSSVTNTTFEGVPSPPSSVITEKVNDTSIRVTWARPDQPNGNIIGYYIDYIGIKNNTNRVIPGINVIITINISDPSINTYLITGLLSDTHYQINVTAYTGAGRGGAGVGHIITLPTGIPPTIPPNVTIGTPPTDGTTDIATENTILISFTIPQELNVNGDITRTRIIVRLYGSSIDIISTWYSSNAAGGIRPWQAIEVVITQEKRKRQNDDQTVTQTVGTDSSCGPNDIVCNGPLKPGTAYQFKYRLYNSDDDNSYVESQYSDPISTDSASNSTTVVVAVVVVLLVIMILVAVLVVIIVVILKRRKRKNYSFAASLNGKEELITAGEGKGATLTKAMQLTSTDPTIVPLTENTIINPAAVRTASVKATPNSRKVYLRDFPSYVDDMLNDSSFKFSEEYEKVSAVGLDHSKDASLLPENRAKNRYTNILAYDHSRVKLESIDDEQGSDYINANYIPGYRMRRAYIATQGPLPSTFDDFWRMVWEQNSHVIVMLTQLVERGRTKCHRYWPGVQPEVYGEINVDMLSETEKSDWIIRKFRLTKEKRSRTITHYQFVSWPDHGVPDDATPAIDFVREVHEVASSAYGPVIVHCSAGVGRTGTFIALGTLLLHIKDHDWIDLFGLASEMRQHRNHMIQTEPQYVFIHKAMVEACQSRIGVKVLPSFNPIYSNVGGTASQQSDFYGDLLSEEVSYHYQKGITSGNGKSYDESTF